MRIFLIGMPGAGKTTLGRQLASLLNYPFLDLDEAIVTVAGLSIPEIFSQFGEAHFRQLEAETLKTVSETDQNLVVATGGGTPCFFNNLEFMNEAGLTVYLKASAEVLAKRLFKTDLAARPLFRKNTEDDLCQFLEETLAKRVTFYARAGIIFETCRPVSDATELAFLIGQRGQQA